MAASRSRSALPASHSAPTHSSMRDAAERRGGRRRARELTCDTCGKVYKHPVCLQKHLWEHNPLWRETAQFLLSKHQQVQVMEAAAILVHGASLPPDRSLWPSYMSGTAGSLASPTLSANGNLRDVTPQFRGSSPPSSPTSSSAGREYPPTSQYDDEELQGVSEEEDNMVDEDDDERTDESDALPSAFSNTFLLTSPKVPATSASSKRGRSYSVGVSAPAPTHMPNIYGSYGWGVITDSGQHSSFRSVNLAGKSPVSNPASPRPMAIPSANGRTFLGHQSMSSFGSIAHSFGSSSTSSYIPSSSIRGGDDEIEEEEDANIQLDAISLADKTNQNNGYRLQFAKMTMLAPPPSTSSLLPERHEEDLDEFEMEMD